MKQIPLSDDSPIMQYWKEYLQSQAFNDASKNIDSLQSHWLTFIAGWEAAAESLRL